MRIDFDVSTLPKYEFEPLEVGTYKAKITECDIKTSNNEPTNAYIKLKLEVVEGKYSGRTLYDYVNLFRGNNPNIPPSNHRQPTNQDNITMGIAARKWRDYIVSSGFDATITNLETMNLLNKVVLISVGIRSTDNFGDQNDIKRVMRVANRQPAYENAMQQRKTQYVSDTPQYEPNTSSTGSSYHSPSPQNTGNNPNPQLQQQPQNFPWERK
jgi:hypothetical protein